MDWVAALFAVAALVAGACGSWWMRQAQQQAERARRAETQVDVYESIEDMKRTIKTDEDAAKAVNNAWQQ